jgi:hypothetical protein
MWLVYLRFEGNGRTKVGHIRCANKEDAQAVVERGRKPDASFEGSQLVEYAFFYAHGTIHVKVAPTSAEPVFVEQKPAS